MYKIKELRYLLLALLLFSFMATATLSSCREQKKQENTEQQGEHPEGEEHSEKDEHPTDAGEEHPTNAGDEHPAKEEEHPTKDEE